MRCFIFFLFFFSICSLQGQCIHVVAYKADAPDTIVIVADGNLSSSDTYYITDNTYNATTNNFSSVTEGVITFKPNQTIPSGSRLLIYVENLSNASVLLNGVNVGSVTAVGIDLSASGDKIYTLKNINPGSTSNTITCADICSVVTLGASGATGSDCAGKTLAGNIRDNGGLLQNFTSLASFVDPTNWVFNDNPIGINVAGLGPISVLPVTFSDPLKAKVVDNAFVELSWITSSEINHDYFEVLHSINGEEFEKILEIKNDGRLSSNIYSILHSTPNLGPNYYRLKQVDLDGRSELFDKIFIEFNTQSKISIYPTLVDNYIQIHGSSNDLKELDLINMMGQKIKKSVSGGQIAVDGLASGLYSIRMNNEIFKFFKL
jgi:hypothetical protein